MPSSSTSGGWYAGSTEGMDDMWIALNFEGGTHYSTNGIGQRQYREALRDLFGIGA